MGGALIAALAVVLLALRGDDLEDEAALPGPPAGKSAFESARDAPAQADPTEEDASTQVNASDLVHPEEAQPHLGEAAPSIGEASVADANGTTDGPRAVPNAAEKEAVVGVARVPSTRAHWERRLARIHDGMTQKEVEELLPQWNEEAQTGRSNLEEGFGLHYTVSAQWGVHVFYSAGGRLRGKPTLWNYVEGPSPRPVLCLLTEASEDGGQASGELRVDERGTHAWTHYGISGAALPSITTGVGTLPSDVLRALLDGIPEGKRPARLLVKKGSTPEEPEWAALLIRHAFGEGASPDER